MVSWCDEVVESLFSVTVVDAEWAAYEVVEVESGTEAVVAGEVY